VPTTCPWWTWFYKTVGRCLVTCSWWACSYYSYDYGTTTPNYLLSLLHLCQVRMGILRSLGPAWASLLYRLQFKCDKIRDFEDFVGKTWFDYRNPITYLSWYDPKLDFPSWTCRKCIQKIPHSPSQVGARNAPTWGGCSLLLWTHFLTWGTRHVPRIYIYIYLVKYSI
jgi:hypothetical protein